MILNLLKENLLKEDINLDEPDIKTVKFSIYEIKEFADFAAFQLPDDDGGSVAVCFGFTQSTWNDYVASGSCKPLVITLNDAPSKVIASMLLWSGAVNNFSIRNGKTIGLPISFELYNNSNSNAYIELLNNYNATLPLRAIFEKFTDFISENWKERLNQEVADGAYYKNSKLIGVFEEFYSLDADGAYTYTDLVFTDAYNQLASQSINWLDRAYSNQNDAHEWTITWSNNVRTWENNPITNDSLDSIKFIFDGDEELENQIKDSFSEELSEKILYDNETEEQRTQRLTARQEAEDRRKAQEWDDDASIFLDRNGDANVDIDDLNDFNQSYLNRAREILQDWTSDLTETQQNYTTKHEDLSAFIENQVHLYDNLIEVEAQGWASDILNKINDLQHRVSSENYVYSLTDTRELEDIENSYNNLTVDYGQRVKDIIAETLNFEEAVTNLRTTLQTKKDELLQQKSQRFAEKGLTLWENILVCKPINHNEIAVVGSRKSQEKTLYIPTEINGLKVTRIENSAFAYNQSFERIYLPITIKYIGPLAFYGTNAVLFIPDQLNKDLVKVGKEAFHSDLTDSYNNGNTLKDVWSKNYSYYGGNIKSYHAN